VVQKLKASINHFYRKCAHKQIILQWKKNKKDSDNFWRRKFTLKVQNWHFLTTCHRMDTQNLVISFDMWVKFHFTVFWFHFTFLWFFNKSMISRYSFAIVWKGYLPNLLETTLLHQISVFWVRDFKLRLLAYFFIFLIFSFGCHTAASQQQMALNFELVLSN
jgi:hypothetical protein